MRILLAALLLVILALASSLSAPSDAAAAQAAPRVLDTAQAPIAVQRGDWVAIPGEDFGSRRGRVHLNGRRVRIERWLWSENLILFQVPDDTILGWVDVEVETRAGHTMARPLLVLAPPPQVLAIELDEQLGAEWCWAAVSTMVMAHFGVDVAQCDQATKLQTGHAAAIDTFDCCTHDAPASTCDQPAPDVQYLRANLLDFGGLSSHHSESPVSFETLVSEIDAERPVILAYTGEGNGHVVVAFGYDVARETVWIHDPLNGTFEVPYDDTHGWRIEDRVFRWSDTILEIDIAG